ncbi:hypothetical protein [Melittangium boletus]|uniref:Uncharacterized protein n=1 Tax=Melittangium boletus DSM 14713 TaxID=1294270 RepID=A0A250IFL1_9BACT|nr:hypothetical protein [Melittangium boletus]ATB29962.1 hypothetical protein MEBOL_003417 [Melittangium boletus DSM 14713]
MAFHQSTIQEREQAQAFTVYIPAALQSELEGLRPDTRHTLVGELFRLAAQSARERGLLPRFGPVTLEFMLAGCDVTLELDAASSRLTLVALRDGWH